MLISRLVFGCGHVTGGVTRRDATALLMLARRAGILHFDTAPSYGMGTAEALVGALFGTDPEVSITAKIGSRRPRLPLARTIARRLLRTVRGSRQALIADDPRPAVSPPTGYFDPSFMRRSLEISLDRLCRRPVDYLLLHEVQPALIDAGLISFMEQALECGFARRVGYANGGGDDPGMRAAFPAGWIAQAAIAPDMLTAAQPSPDPAPAPTSDMVTGSVGQAASTTILHTVIKTGRWLIATDPRYAIASRETVSTFERLVSPEALGILLPFYLAATNVPHAKLIYASSDRTRVAAILGAAEQIDAAAAGIDIADAFARFYRSR